MGLTSSTSNSIKFLRPAAEGAVVEMSITNPTPDERHYVSQQKHDLDAKLGKKIRKTIIPNYRESFQRQPMENKNVAEEARRGIRPLELVKRERLGTPKLAPVIAECVQNSYYGYFKNNSPV